MGRREQSGVLRVAGRKLRPLFRKGATERELEEELSFHIDMHVEMLMREGKSEAEARREALVAFGGVERYKEQVRQARWVRWLEDLLMDVRYALRSIVRYRGFAAAVVVTLALGIGGTTAIFSVVDGLFLRTPQGVQDAEYVRRLMIERDEGMIQTPDGGPGSYIDYEALSTGARSFEGVAAYFARQADLGRGAEAEQVRTMAVTANYFNVLGVRPALGRFFLTEEDGVQGAHPVAVISHGLWQRRFGASPAVLDETIMLNGKLLSIVGVAEKSFVGTTADVTEVWVPTAMAGPLQLMGMGADSDWRTMEGMAGVDYIARVKRDVTPEQVVADGSAALARKAEEYAGMDQTPKLMLQKLTAASSPGRAGTMNSLSLWLALVAALVLIIAAANVANLLLARAVARRRELALRLSLGAARNRIVRQSMTESVVLALLGGVAGLLVAHWSRGLFAVMELPPWAARTDLRLLGFAIGLSIVTAVLFGLLPAIRSVRVDPLHGMQDTRVMPSVGRSHTRRALVALQVSLSLALLIGAGLFVRSLREALAIDTGVDLQHLAFVQIDLKKAGYTDADAEQFWEQARQRLEQVPGVRGVALVHFAPFVGMAYAGPLKVPGVELPDFEGGGPYWNMAGPGYFRVAGTRVVDGREFTEADARGEPVVIVNRELANGISRGGSVVGRCLQVGEQTNAPETPRGVTGAARGNTTTAATPEIAGACTRIVGVVETQRHRYLEEANRPMLYLARAQNPNAVKWGGPSLIVRTSGNAEEHVGEIRAAVAGLRGDLPFVNARPLTELVRRDLLPFQLGATLFSMFSVLALALAAVGLYGVLGYFVSERRPEIGIRRSLGAQASSVIALVVRQSFAPVAAGLAIGLVVAFIATRFLETLLFGVHYRDAVSFLAAVAFLLIVATAATLLPALRAARVDPMVALRTD